MKTRSIVHPLELGGLVAPLLLLLVVVSVLAGRPASALGGTAGAMSPKADPIVEVPINRDAGRGNWLFLTVSLASGRELLFELDTGASCTCFDRSLEPILGERLGTGTNWQFGVSQEVSVYAAPELRLGGMVLRTATSQVISLDLRKLAADAGYPVVGILGMDVLRNYCVQLDFAANRLRLLDPEHADRKAWGDAIALAGNAEACPIIDGNLIGSKAAAASLIDVGYSTDGWLAPALFAQWTSGTTGAAAEGVVHAPNGLFYGEPYPRLDLDGLDEKLLSSGDSYMLFNGIGLRFLARHLVTFDFPARTMYLKRTSSSRERLSLKADYWRPVGRSAFQYLSGLKAKGQLPGWLASDKFAGRRFPFRTHSYGLGILELRKKGDLCIFHYEVVRATENSPWRLQKAWRTSGDDHHAPEEFALP